MTALTMKLNLDPVIMGYLSEPWVKVALFLVFAPIIGGLLAGIDRKFAAFMQGRVGPPIVQPFYDVLKLLGKERLKVNKFQNFNIFLYFIFIVFTGAMFFAGVELLLVIFALSLAEVLFVLGGFSVRSPYSHTGAERELIQIMAYDPMVIILAIGMYMVTGTFRVDQIAMGNYPLIVYLPGIFIGFCYILTFKLRKSPFDLSMSHHAHQELVKGITTEYSGRTLALIEISHWYENLMLMGIVYLFFAFNPIIGVVVCLGVWMFETFIDNTYGRFKWDLAFKSAWIATIIVGVSNLIVLYFVLPK